jgi:hypothetical protein
LRARAAHGDDAEELLGDVPGGGRDRERADVDAAIA